MKKNSVEAPIQPSIKDTKSTTTIMLPKVPTTLDVHIAEEHSHACSDEVGCCSSGCGCHDLSLNLERPEPFRFAHRILPFGISLFLVILGVIFERVNFFENSRLTSIIFFGISYAISSYPVLLAVVQNLKLKTVFDENFLMLIATLAAIFTSNFLEAIAVMLFYKVGEIVEDYGVYKSKKSISTLLNSQPEIAHLKTDKGLQDVSPTSVSVGDTLVIKPGEKVPIDGQLLSPIALLDTAALTGESMPRRAVKADQILAGMVNLSQLLELRVTQLYQNSAIAKIINLVQNAEENKSKTEKFTRKFAKYYTPSVVVAAVLLALIPPLAIPGATFSEWIYRAAIFLVISCPCALVISVPLAYFGGIGGASRHGILIKGTQYLERLASLDTLVFDKTGTITKGNFHVSQIQTLDGYSKHELLAMVASAELYSNHPVAQSIVESFGEQNLIQTKYQVSDYCEIPGIGINAKLDGITMVVGNDRILHQYKVPHDPQYCSMPGTVVHIGIDQKHVGFIIIIDEVRHEAEDSIHKLRDSGISKLVMLSGDDSEIVQSVASRLGFDAYEAELLPEDKLSHFSHLKSPSNSVGYVGDGINDAPVLAQADVGFAMGSLGSDVAVEAADVVLMTDDIGKIYQAIQVARQTRKINWQNIFLIFAVKALFLLLGAIGLMTMWGAVFADVGTAFIAIVNSRRILAYTPK